VNLYINAKSIRKLNTSYFYFIKLTAILVGFFYGRILNAQTTTGIYNGLKYSSDGASITITGYTNINGSLTVPSTINGLPVTTLGLNCLQAAPVTTVTIPSSVTTLLQGALCYCSQLTSVTIPASVTSLGPYVFQNDYNLKTISVDTNNPNYVSNANGVYSKDMSILISATAQVAGTFNIPNSVVELSASSFSTCSGLQTLIIPSSVTTIDGSLISSESTSLTSVYFQGNVAPLSRNYSGPFDAATNCTVYYLASTDGWWGNVYGSRPLVQYFTAPTAPSITYQPVVAQSIYNGSNTTLTVSAIGSTPLNYQWYLNGVPLLNSNTPALLLSNVSTQNAGSYTVQISNSAGSIMSSASDLSVTSSPSQNPVIFEDVFGRRINESGITLVDWEGQIANPAIKVLVYPPNGLTYPVSLTISASEQRLYFDTPSTTSATGPTKTLTFTNSNPQSFYVSIYPDRDGNDENYNLNFFLKSASNVTLNQTLSVHVIDQDQPTRSLSYPIPLDFSQDGSGFFTDINKQTIATQAAQDWMYYFDGTGLDNVNIGSEITSVFNPTFKNFNSLTANDSRYVKNTYTYTGYLLYAEGVSANIPPFRSTGLGSYQGNPQTVNGGSIFIRRSGVLAIETKGNYNSTNWVVSNNDEEWWKATNLGNVANDLLSIMHHEVGHSLFFDGSNPVFQALKNSGSVNDTKLIAYHGHKVSFNASNHLGGFIDRISGFGAFGNEYFGGMPMGRWTITKLSLLAAQACGYKLRDTTVFQPLSITNNTIAAGILNTSYNQILTATGGIPYYNWTIKSGSLPSGLTLNSFSGLISGIPTVSGTYNFTVQVQEYDLQNNPVTMNYSLVINTVGTPPTIISNPTSQKAINGNSVTLSVVASGTSPSYQWYLNNSALPGATSSTYTIPIVSPNNAGSYSVKITNSAGSIVSQAAIITVENPGHLTNLSVLSLDGPDSQLLTIGFVSGGVGTSGSQNLLIRGIGPAIGLAPFNVPNVLMDPSLTVFNSSTVAIATNDNWGTPTSNAAAVTAADTATGAFALTSNASLDSAVVTNLPAGSYTVQISGKNGATGNVIAEVYDNTPANSYTISTPRLVNISCLEQVASGGVLTAGFVIGGTTPEQVLIRASGPTLAAAPFNVPGTIADPKLTVYNSSSTVLATNTGWGGNASITAANSATGAFQFINDTSKDSAVVLTLQPGAYTVQATSASGKAGITLIEVYEVPSN
jgi:BspA type Leucine rich repeat region (6 copies)/Putative Ig domain/Immunoglobulin domain